MSSRISATGDEHERAQWQIHGERLVDENPFIQLSIASVELPDGSQFEQYVMRTRSTAPFARVARSTNWSTPYRGDHRMPTTERYRRPADQRVPAPGGKGRPRRAERC